MTALPIAEAAQRLRTTPRMLRYREALGLLAPRRGGGRRRVYGDRDLLAAAYAADLEERYDVTPKAIAFALRVLSEPQAAADVRRLGVLVQRVAPSPTEALDFESAKARRLLRLQG